MNQKSCDTCLHAGRTEQAYGEARGDRWPHREPFRWCTFLVARVPLRGNDGPFSCERHEVKS